ELRYQVAGADQYKYNDKGAFQHHQQKLDHDVLSPARHERDHQHHGHDHNILKNQNTECYFTVRGADLPIVLQQFEHYGGTAERNQETDKEAFGCRKIEHHQDKAD